MNSRPSLKTIRLSVLLQNVEFRQAADGDCGYEIRTRFPGGILHERKDSTLSITEKVFSLHRVFRLAEFLRGAGRPTIILHVPKDFPLDTVYVKNISGKTTIHGITCRTLEVGASSGNTAVCASRTDEFHARQTSGRLTVDGCVMDNANIVASSGSVEMKNMNTHGLAISSTSGKVAFSGVPAGRSEIRTSSGGVTLDIAGEKRNYDLAVDVRGGSIFLDGLQQAGRQEAGRGPPRRKWTE